MADLVRYKNSRTHVGANSIPIQRWERIQTKAIGTSSNERQNLTIRIDPSYPIEV